jgi:exosortase N
MAGISFVLHGKAYNGQEHFPQIVQLSGTPCEVSGNLISLNGTGFSVDPACMGLNMMITSLLTGVILLAFYQRSYRLQLQAWKVLLVLGFISCLNIFSNLFRIIALVQFNIMPGNIMHEITGMACFILYVMLPGMLACKWTVQHWGKIRNDQQYRALSPRIVKTPLLHALVIISMLFAVYGFQGGKTAETPVFPAVNGYKIKALEDGIVKLQNKNALVYVKRIENFYRSGHNPLICWEGSGYLFRQVREDEMQGIKMYTGILQNGKDQLYTAWWFDNGRQITIDQLTWRWDMLRGGDPYSIENVTAGSREKMESEVRLILQTRRLRHFL